MKRSMQRAFALALAILTFADTCCYGLATIPASQNPIAKREILATLQRTQIRCADSDYAKRLLASNDDAKALLLSSGKYLVSKDTADDDVRLLKAIIHEDIEALLQIISKDEGPRYSGIKELILRYFPPMRGNTLAIEPYVNHTIAKAFEWLLLINEGIISRHEVPPDESVFLAGIEPIVNSHKSNYFTAEFWDPGRRGKKIKAALDRGFVFYLAASSPQKREPKAFYIESNLERIFSKEEMAIILPLLKSDVAEDGVEARKNAMSVDAYIQAFNEIRQKRLAYLDSLALKKDPEVVKNILSILRKNGQPFYELAYVLADGDTDTGLSDFSEIEYLSVPKYYEKPSKPSYYVKMKSEYSIRRALKQLGLSGAVSDKSIIEEALMRTWTFTEEGSSYEKCAAKAHELLDPVLDIKVYFCAHPLSAGVDVEGRQLHADKDKAFSIIVASAAEASKNADEFIAIIEKIAGLIKIIRDGNGMRDDLFLATLPSMVKKARTASKFQEALELEVLELALYTHDYWNKIGDFTLTVSRGLSRMILFQHDYCTEDQVMTDEYYYEIYYKPVAKMDSASEIFKYKTVRDAIQTVEKIITVDCSNLESVLEKTKIEYATKEQKGVRYDISYINDGWPQYGPSETIYTYDIVVTKIIDRKGPDTAGLNKRIADISNIMLDINENVAFDIPEGQVDDSHAHIEERDHRLSAESAVDIMRKVIERFGSARQEAAQKILIRIEKLRRDITQGARTNDCMLIRALPDIAQAVEDPDSFLAALDIESAVFHLLSREETVFEQVCVCSDYGYELYRGENKAPTIYGTVFSHYARLFDNSTALSAFVRKLAAVLKYKPVLTRTMDTKEKLFAHISELSGKSVNVARQPTRVESVMIKCIILDCDGVLWDGVIGEDGVKGIRISPAHVEFQKKLKGLRDRGIVLAINSKNDLVDVEAVLRQRPEMVLKREDFAAVRANWQDKATNIKEIACTLNIGIDSLVFVDDSPEERALISGSLPQVITPELPKDPSQYVKTLEDLGLFSNMTVTVEDKRRTEMLAELETRRTHRRQFTSTEDYYRSLDMRAVIREGAENLPYISRIAQLTQRTNQFNLTMVRYTEDEIRKRIDDVYTLELIDRFGNAGIVGVMIVKKGEIRLNKKKSIIEGFESINEIEEFCLSCRAVGLTVEQALMAHVVKRLKLSKSYRGGGDKLAGRYTPTDRNSLVKDMYPKMGFTASEEEGAENHWEVYLDKFEFKPPEWIKTLDIYNPALNPKYGSIRQQNERLAAEWFAKAKEQGLEDTELRKAWEKMSVEIRDPEFIAKLLALEINYVGLEVGLREVTGDYEKTTVGCERLGKCRQELIAKGYEILKEDCVEVDREHLPHIYETYELYYAFSGKAKVMRAAVPYAAHICYYDFMSLKYLRRITRAYDLCIKCGDTSLLPPGTSDTLPRYPVLNYSLKRVLEEYGNKTDDEWDEYLASQYPASVLQQSAAGEVTDAMSMLKKIERIAHDFSIHEGSAYRRHTITKIDQSQMVEFLPKLERICSDKKRFIMALNIEVALHGLVPGVLITYTSNDGYCPDSGFAFTKYDHILYIRSATQELLEKLGSEDKLKAFIDKWGDYYTKNRDKVGFKIWNFLLDAIYSDRDPATEDVLSRITEIGISEIFGETPICGNFESMSKSDTESAAVLLADLINAKLCDDLVYEVKYDISRLSPSQVKIVEQYIEHVRTNCAKRDNIKSRPFSSAEGSKESLIAVYCTGRNFKGEGHVDVKISLSGLSAYVLRLPSMLNIAFASASVPSSVINSREDRVKYEGLISFIKNEYVAVTGLPGSPPVEFSDLSRIIIELPKAHKVGSDAVEEYNRLTIEALSRFV